MHTSKTGNVLTDDEQYLIGMLEDELTAEEAAYEMNISLHHAKHILNQLLEMKYVKCLDGKYQLDAQGTKKLLELSAVLK